MKVFSTRTGLQIATLRRGGEKGGDSQNSSDLHKGDILAFSLLGSEQLVTLCSRGTLVLWNLSALTDSGQGLVDSVQSLAFDKVNLAWFSAQEDGVLLATYSRPSHTF